MWIVFGRHADLLINLIGSKFRVQGSKGTTDGHGSIYLLWFFVSDLPEKNAFGIEGSQQL